MFTEQELYQPQNHAIIGVKYRNAEVQKLYDQLGGVATKGSAAFDLCTAQTVTFDRDTPAQTIDLGVVIRLPANCHAILSARSSTFGRYGLMLTNGIGVIDNDYCGENDYWLASFIWIRQMTDALVIPAGTRLCQFQIVPTVKILPPIDYIPGVESRGGFGSTGA
jgi:dUTP pyrophosphatase